MVGFVESKEGLMPVTISYDLKTDDPNQRNYLRSMLERFGWKRLGGSVFRYPESGQEEDWMNCVIPALMFFRSYVLKNNIEIKFFTLDANSISMIDNSDPHLTLGAPPADGRSLTLANPTNPQSSEKRIRDFVDAAIGAT
jgi:hypothetical protein